MMKLIDHDHGTTGKKDMIRTLLSDRSSASSLMTPHTNMIQSVSDTSPDLAISSGTIKLPFDELGIYGRKTETIQLQQAVYRLVGMDTSSMLEMQQHHLMADVSHDGKTCETTMTTIESSTISGTSPPSSSNQKRFIAGTNSKKEFVLVSGYSGTGKTTLVSSSVEELVQQRLGGTFAIGKFDQCLGDKQQEQQVQRPFTAFRMICQTLAEDIVTLRRMEDSSSSSTSTRTTEKQAGSSLRDYHNQRGTFRQLKDAIMMELGTELIDLIQVFPSLDIIISTKDDESMTMVHKSGSERSNDSFGSSKEQQQSNHVAWKESYGNVANPDSRYRFIYAFRMLLRIISSFLSPLVFVLDDLQWADAASLDLLQGILSDHAIKQLMIVGIYRSNEVDDTHIVAKTIRDIRSKASEHDVHVADMEIGNLDVRAVEELFQALVSIGTTTTTNNNMMMGKGVNELATICHKKTNGNVFHLIHFVSMIRDNGLLSYNSRLLEWQWNVNDIDQATSATQNVVDILKQEMANLSSDNQRLLQYAAYLGSAFDARTIYVLWKDDCQRKQSSNRVAGTTRNSSSRRLQKSNDKIRPKPSSNDGSTSTSTSTSTSNSHLDKDKIRKDLRERLKSCIEAGFLERLSRQNVYRWVHDKLQEAAMGLVSPEDHCGFSRRIAEVLENKLSAKELEASLFVVVNWYNEGTAPKVSAKRLALARLNLRAANKAVSYSAFESVSIYCDYGIKLLPVDCWDKHYRLSLDLFSLGTEAEAFLGKLHKMELYCNEVLRQKERKDSGSVVSSPSSSGGVHDKLRVYNVMVNSIGNRGFPKDAVDLCLNVLRQYGTKFPSNKAGVMLRVMYNIGKLKSSVSQRVEEEAQNLPRMNDQTRAEQMSLLDKLSAHLYFVDKNMFLLPIFKTFHWTLKYGFSTYSPASFASLALLLASVLGDLNGGAIYARSALLLLSRLGPVEAKQVESRTLFIVYTFALHWTQPLERMLKPMIRGYEVGMQSGDTESATFCIGNFIWVSLISGRNLASIEGDCRVYIKQMKQLKKDTAMNNCRITWQFILNLMGKSQFKTRLTGEALKEDVCRKQGEEDEYLLTTLEMHKIMLFSIFGDYENGAKLALEVGNKLQKISPGPAFIPLDTFHRGLCMLAMARKLKQTKEGSDRSNSFPCGPVAKLRGMETKCIKSAKQQLAKIKNWIEKGNPNVSHYESLLEAELTAYEGRQFLARKNYETAVTMASQAGFLQDCALANERYGEFLYELWENNDVGKIQTRERSSAMTIHGKNKNDINNCGSTNGSAFEMMNMEGLDDENLQQARSRIQESIDLYRGWGAAAKADFLEEKYSNCLLSAFPNNIEICLDDNR